MLDTIDSLLSDVNAPPNALLLDTVDSLLSEVKRKGVQLYGHALILCARIRRARRTRLTAAVCSERAAECPSLGHD